MILRYDNQMTGKHIVGYRDLSSEPVVCVYPPRRLTHLCQEGLDGRKPKE
jgi:hypothetical protein